MPWTEIIENLNGEKFVRKCYEKELQKTNQTEFRIEKVGIDFMKGYDNSCPSWIDKKDIVTSNDLLSRTMYIVISKPK